jgi:hypothetical protein
MAKLHSFEDYVKIRQEQVSAEIEAQKEAAREETIKSFKGLLAEYGVTKVSELDEDQREEFFGKLDGTDLNEAFIEEAVIVTGKRDAKKVMNTYIKFFEKYPALGPDAMGVPADHVIGAVKELYAAAMEDANFSREVPATVNKMKGRLFTKEVKVAELNNYTVSISTGKLAQICRDHGSNIAGAAKWSGLAIVEGTAMYLDHINYGKYAEALLNAFNATFESAEELEARILEGNEFGAARAKAIADGKDEFEVDGKKYKVTKVDADDKENAEEFANESEINGENPNPAGYPSPSGDSEDVEETEGEEVEVMEEGEVSEAEVKSAEEFKEYAFNVLQQAFGDDFDETKAQEVVDGILSKVDGDFGAAVGMLQSSLG